MVTSAATSPRVIIGRTGTENNGGIFTEDYNTKMQHPTIWTHFERMDNDQTIYQIKQGITLPVRRAEFELEGDSKEIKEWVESQLFDDRRFENWLEQALEYYFWGFAMFEVTYAVEEGKTVWQDIGYRHQRTIEKWNFDGDTLRDIEQMAEDLGTGAYKTVNIPADKLMLFTANQRGRSYAGKGLYRVLWKIWSMKEAVEKYLAMYCERIGAGIPVVTIPTGMSDADADKLETIMKKFRAGEHQYFIGTAGMTVDLLQGGTQGQTDLIAVIKHYEEDMAKAALLQFLNLGTTQTGSRSLGEDMSAFFLRSAQAMGDYIAEVFNREIKRLCSFNFPNEEDYPTLVVRGIAEKDVEGLSRAFKNFVDAGAIDAKDPKIQVYTRALMDLPEMDEDDLKAAEEERDAAREQRLAPPVAPGASGVTSAPAKFTDDPPMSPVAISSYFGNMDPAKRANVLRGLCGKYEDENTAVSQATARVASIDARLSGLRDRIGKKATQFYTNYMETLVTAISEGNAPQSVRPARVDKAVEGMSAETTEAYGAGQKDYGAPVAEFIEWEPRTRKELKAKLMIGVRKIQDSAEIALMQAKRTGLTGAKRTEYLTQQIYGLSEANLQRSIREVVNVAYGDGRQAAARKMNAPLEVYAAVMDRDACYECMVRDGQVHRAGDPDYLTGGENRHCLGHDACRCINIPLEESDTFYDPDQPRDDPGMWAAGRSIGGSTAKISYAKGAKDKEYDVYRRTETIKTTDKQLGNIRAELNDDIRSAVDKQEIEIDTYARLKSDRAGTYTSGTFNKDKKARIQLNKKNYNEQEAAWALDHEYGHHITFTAPEKLRGKNGWDVADIHRITGEGVTEYARISWDENFAESFAAYRNNPKMLKKKAPKMYAFMKEVVFK